MTAHDKTIAKIQKLFAMASEDGGATEGERDNALRMAQELMLKHGLEMSEVAAKGDTSRNVITEAWDDEWIPTGDLREDLMCDVARGCHCRPFFYHAGYGEKKRNWQIIGRPENIAYARAVYAFVLPQVEAEIAKALRARDKRAQYARRYGLWAAATAAVESGASYSEAVMEAQGLDDLAIADAGKARAAFHGNRDALCSEMAMMLSISASYATDVSPFVRRGEIAPEEIEDLGVWRRSFTRSCCATIRLRLRDAQRSFVEEHGDAAQALVVQEDAAVNAFADTLGLSKSSSSAQIDASGWRTGAAAGKGVTLGGNGALSSQRRQIAG